MALLGRCQSASTCGCLELPSYFTYFGAQNSHLRNIHEYIYIYKLYMPNMDDRSKLSRGVLEQPCILAMEHYGWSDTYADMTRFFSSGFGRVVCLRMVGTA